MQFENEFAICVYGVRCNTSYTKIAKKTISNVTNERWQKIETSMSPKHRYENIDVKNIDIESKALMFSMFPMLMSHH